MLHFHLGLLSLTLALCQAQFPLNRCPATDPPSLFFEQYKLANQMSNPAVYYPAQFLKPSSLFKLSGAALQIFTQLRIPCTGFLTSWALAPKDVTGFTGLHMAIFRQTADGKFLKIANSTKISVSTFLGQVQQQINGSFSTTNAEGYWRQFYPLARISSDFVDTSRVYQMGATAIGNGWLEILLPTQLQIPVQAGDLVGHFYEQFETQELKLAVKYNELDFQRGQPATWVYNEDFASLSQNSSSSPFRDLDLSRVSGAYREPAVSFKLSTRQVFATPWSGSSSANSSPSDSSVATVPTLGPNPTSVRTQRPGGFTVVPGWQRTVFWQPAATTKADLPPPIPTVRRTTTRRLPATQWVNLW